MTGAGEGMETLEMGAEAEACVEGGGALSKEAGAGGGL